MNWLNLLENALKVGIAIKSVSDIDAWIDEKIRELQSDRTFASALVEIAHEVALMNSDAWEYLKGHLSVKALRNSNAEFFFNYCNYVVNLENGNIRDLLSYSLHEAWDIFSFNLRSMETYEIAAHYGILKAYSQSNMKARALTQEFDRLLN